MQSGEIGRQGFEWFRGELVIRTLVVFGRAWLFETVYGAHRGLEGVGQNGRVGRRATVWHVLVVIAGAVVDNMVRVKSRCVTSYAEFGVPVFPCVAGPVFGLGRVDGPRRKFRPNPILLL